MKYADMKRLIDADRYAKASGKKPEDAPVAEGPRRPDRSARVHSRMWANPRPRAECSHVQTVKLPFDAKRGDVLVIEHYVVEEPPLHEVERMYQTAELVGDPKALPMDLFAALDGRPFDDALEAKIGQRNTPGERSAAPAVSRADARTCPAVPACAESATEQTCDPTGDPKP